MFGESEAPTPGNLSFVAPEFSQTQYPEKVFPLAKVREIVQTYSAPTSTFESASAPASGTISRSDFRWAQLQVIGQLQQTYIVAQSETHFYLIDQHAAHERVVFERLMATFRSKKLDVQTLLLPLAFDLDPAEVEALIAREEFLSQMGFAVERMGPATVAVQTLPALITESAVQQTIVKLAHDLLNTNDDSALELKIGDIFASMACHSVVRAGQTLSPEQMSGLLQQMDEFALSSFCPHGRPVYIQRRFTEIEREFGRIP
jgi:DNA mismatch repair protein MutL